MLVLSRDVRPERQQQDIIIVFGDQEVTMRLCEIRSGQQVRLGFCTSKDVVILRRESYEQIEQRSPKYVPEQREVRDVT